jgi:FlaA1/EpsC-like NDP-sugar epimerase
MGDPIKIVDLAENMIRVAGFIPGVDMKVEYTGLRPGEKLYEELLLDGEGAEKTQNDKIYIARPANIASNLEREIASDFAKHRDVMILVRKYVPEYRRGGEPYSEPETISAPERSGGVREAQFVAG